MRVAICDDEQVFRMQMRAALESYTPKLINCSIEEFPDGRSLVYAHNVKRFDIILLDIHMDDITGLQVGRLIREKDRTVIIILVTSYPEYVFSSFKIQTFDYIVKPYEIQEFNKVFRNAVNMYNHFNGTILINWKDKKTVLKLGDIEYIKIGLKSLEIYNAGDEIHKCDGKMSEFEEKLANHFFVRTHRSFLLNLDCIEEIGFDRIITRSGKEVWLSKHKRKSIVAAYIAFTER